MTGRRVVTVGHRPLGGNGAGVGYLADLESTLELPVESVPDLEDVAVDGDLACLVYRGPLAEGDRDRIGALRDRGGDRVPLVYVAADGERVPATLLAGPARCVPLGETADPTAATARAVRDLLDHPAEHAGGAGVPTVVVDPDGTIQMVNGAMAEHLGYDREELVGADVSMVMPEADIERGRELVGELLESDRQWGSFEIHTVSRDGERTRNEDKIAVLTTEGEFTGTVGVVRDIEARKARERELEQYETIVETVPDGVFVVDEEGTIVGGNTTGVEMLGFDRKADLLGERIPDLVSRGILHEEVVEQYLEVVPDLLSAEADRDTAAFEFRTFPDTDEERYYEARIALRPFEETFRGSIGILRDVTERKRRLEELERYETLVRTVPDTVYATDEDGYVRFLNEAGEQRFGYTRAEVERTDLHFSDVVADEDVETFRTETRHLLSTADPGAKAVVEHTAVTKDGRRFRAETHYSLWEPGDETFAGAGIVRDVTDRDQRRERLAVLDRVLRHNIRNELGVVLGVTELLAKRFEEVHDDRRGRRLVGRAREHARELHRLSEEIRQVQRTLEREGADRPVVDAVTVVESVTDTYRARYPRATVGTDLPDSAPVEADDSLELALENLVENAIEHNDGDAPTVEVSIADADAGRGDWVVVRVADDGPGIPQHEQAVLDEDIDVTPLQHGSGIGLWTVAWIVESFDGSVEIDNRAEGAVVSLYLRRAE